MDDPVDDERPPPAQERPATLGSLIDAMARRRTLALRPHFAWAPPLVPVLRKVQQMSGVVGERFDRFEGPASAPLALRRAGPQAGAMTGRGGRPFGEASAGQPSAGEAWPAAGSAGPAGPDLDGGADHRRERPEARALPPSARYRLRQEVGPAADAMRVHDGPRADALARRAGADAVTVGRDVHLRQGRYAPHRQEGLALLAHEATHVAFVLEPGSAWRKAVGGDAEEPLAREREALMLGGARGVRTPPVPSWPGASTHAATALPPRDGVAPFAAGRAGAAAGPSRSPAESTAAPAVQRAADTDRDLAVSPAAPDLDGLRRSLVADVMRQIKTEFERGG